MKLDEKPPNIKLYGKKILRGHRKLVEIFENAWKAKKSKCQNHNKWSPKICKIDELVPHLVSEFKSDNF